MYGTFKKYGFLCYLLLLSCSHVPELVYAQLVGVAGHGPLLSRPLLHAVATADLLIVLLLLLLLAVRGLPVLP